MSDFEPILDEPFFIEGVMWRRCVAWVVDAVLIGLLAWVLWWILVMIGVVTLGLGFALMPVLALVPFAYNMLSLLGSATATPGQAMLGLTVRRDEDLGPPTALQALISTLGYYVTLATSGLLLLVALFTTRHRTLHDLVSGLVVVRTRAMRALTASQGGWNMPAGTSAR